MVKRLAITAKAAPGAILLLALLVAGCADLPLRDRAGLDAEIERAERLSAGERHADAASVYEQLAADARPADRFLLATRAAREYLAAGRLDDARRMLPAADDAPDGERFHEWAPVAARIALARGRPDDALAALDRIRGDLPRVAAMERHELAAEALFELGEPVAAIAALLEREALLDDAEEIHANHRAIWRGLQDGGSAVLEAARDGHEDAEIAGWLALGAVAVNAARNPFGLSGDIARWREAHPGHPADRQLVAEVLQAYRGLTDYPRQIALLLPLSGRQSSAGTAVRDGFMAAYYEHADDTAGQRPQVRVYDTAAQSATEAYRRALLDGADFVIGPLVREETEAVATVAGSVPTLALNQLDPNVPVPPNFYQFSLDPDDEAAQVARMAARRDGGRAVVLVAGDDWGRRLLQSFTHALEDDGGSVIDFARYPAWEQDFSEPITRLLHIDRSEQRRRELADALGESLQFQPRLRQDIDFIFLAARNAQARLIRPQLRYFFAGGIPLYSTSAVHDPGGGPDGDLNGIIFPDAPWLVAADDTARRVRAQLERYSPAGSQRLGRLHAMGFDTYRLVPALFASGDEAGRPTIAGMSGHLKVDPQGRVRRDLAWAQYRGGRPQPLLPGITIDDDEAPEIPVRVPAAAGIGAP